MSDFANKGRPAGRLSVDPEPASATLTAKSPDEERAAASAQINRTLNAWRTTSAGAGSIRIQRKAEDANGEGADAKGEGADAKGEGADAKGEGADAKGEGADKDAGAVSNPDEPAEKEADEVADGVAEEDEKESGKSGKDEKQAPIAAKLEGVGRKIMRAPKGDKPRVGMVPGLYDSVGGSPAPGGMQLGDLVFTDTVLDKFPDGSPRSVLTKVRLPGTDISGNMNRSLHVEKDGKRTLVMDSAFLDQIPDKQKWVTDDGKALRPGQGTPLQTYMTIRQMKILKIDFGDLGKPNFTQVKMSTIINRRTIWELAKLVNGTDAMPTSEQLMQTHSVQYAMTPIEQAGARVVKAELGKPGVVIDALQFAQEKNDTGEMTSRGLSASAKVRKNFEIVLEVAPYTPSSAVPAEVSDQP